MISKYPAPLCTPISRFACKRGWSKGQQDHFQVPLNVVPFDSAWAESKSPDLLYASARLFNPYTFPIWGCSFLGIPLYPLVRYGKFGKIVSCCFFFSTRSSAFGCLLASKLLSCHFIPPDPPIARGLSPAPGQIIFSWWSPPSDRPTRTRPWS